MNISYAHKTITHVDVTCNEPDCESIRNKFLDFIGVEAIEETIKERFRFKLFDRSISRLSYQLVSNADENRLVIESGLKSLIGKIQIQKNIDIALPGMLSYSLLKEGEYFDALKLDASKESLNKYLSDRGFLDSDINIITKKNFNKIDIVLDINLRDIVRVKDVRIITTNPNLLGRVQSKFTGFNGEFLDRLQFRLAVDQLTRELFESGFYESEVTVLPDEVLKESNEVILRVQVKYGSLYSFNFEGNHFLSRANLISAVNDSILRSGVKTDDKAMVDLVALAYKDIGLYNTRIQLRVVRGQNRSGLSYVNFFYSIDEGKKIPVRKIAFNGNDFLSNKQLYQLYKKNSTPLARSGYLDEEFIGSFTNEILREYFSNGYVQAEVSAPELVIDDDGEASVSYIIRERQPTTVKSVSFSFDEKSTEDLLTQKLSNKVGLPLDITKLDEDLNLTVETLQSLGYFFAEIEDVDDTELLSYSPNHREANISIPITSFRKTYLNSIIITGYTKTKLEVITREIMLKQGDLIVPQDVVKIRDRLSALDLFSSVRVTPFVIEELTDEANDSYQVNLLVQLQEKDFGIAEIAPGYRTDLGFKFSSGLTYNNLYGMNRSASLQAEANRRFNYSDFDARRRQEQRQLIEYLVRASFTEPYLFPGLLKTQFQFDISAAIQRKRFVSFDADLFRISPQISKQVSNSLTLALKYQFETISQFDATNPELNDNFAIGSLTPSATLDFRDDAVRPTKGSIFNLSWEFANPYFLSMEDEDITINYYRMTSRNSFYYSPSPHLTFALSISMGVQKNFATDERLDKDGNPIFLSDGRISKTGFIPSTKVFRLDGIDTVRGFSAEEINRLTDGRNVGDVVVNDVAYFGNIKLEPRYYFNDTFAAGIFFDAGRVFLNKFNVSELRLSTGSTLKILTPVGTLDFDYGIKLKRERFSSELREKFGRFHLSIGFF